jgi:hypothetical protein
MSNLSRRSLVAGAASLPALAAGSATAATIEVAPDPVFALVDAYRKACAQTEAADEQHVFAACDAQAEAVRKLCHTPPTTFAGLAAALGFVINTHRKR